MPQAYAHIPALVQKPKATQPVACLGSYSVSCIQYVRDPSATWKPGKSGDMNFICPGPEIAWNLPKTVIKQEIEQKTWIKPGLLKINNISILY